MVEAGEIKQYLQAALPSLDTEALHSLTRAQRAIISKAGLWGQALLELLHLYQVETP